MSINRTHEFIIQNLYPGSLTIVDQNNNEIILNNYGDEEYITVADLQSIKNKNRKLLEAGCIGITDEEVIEYIRMGNVFNYCPSVEEFEKLVNYKATKKIKDLLKGASDIQKRVLALRAVYLSKHGKLDSATVRDLFIQSVGNVNLFKT